MKTISALLAVTVGMSALCITERAAAAPKIQFDQTTYDFGQTSQVATVSGVFKFKNTGDAVLKIEPPRPSCGCTIAELKTNTLAPGESGELGFTLHLGLVKSQMEKQIAVTSNDPLTPELSLTIKADYTPLYEINPMVLSPNLAFGSKEVDQFATITRTDGRPLNITRLAPSQPWITAKIDPATKTNDVTARVRITVQREGLPRRFNEFVHIYTADQTNGPAAGIALYGQIMGEVSLSPEALYWSVTDNTNAPADRPEALVMRRVTIQMANGKGMELKNPQSSIKGIKVELVPKEAGKVYELVARLDEIPASTVSGSVSFETSVATQSRIEVPVIVNVFKP